MAKKELLTQLLFSARIENQPKAEPYWFPGRWVGGFALILGPLLLWLGVVIRLGHPFFFPQQLAAFHAFPTQMQTSYSLFLAGNMLLWPAIATLAQVIGRRKPNWALWGGTMVIFGIFARTFHAGIDHLSFQVVRFQNLELATKTIA